MNFKIKKHNLFIYSVFFILLVLAITNPSEKKLIHFIQETGDPGGEKVIERTKNGIVFSVYKVYFNAKPGNSTEYLGVLNSFYQINEKGPKK